MARSKITLRSDRTDAAASRARVVPTIFFLIWLAIPTVIAVVAIRDFAHDLRTWRWTATPCTIVSSGVEERESRGGPVRAPDYAFAVRYRYSPPGTASTNVEAGGPNDLTSATYARGYKGGADYAKAQRLALQHPPGSAATCYVNPGNPTESVLKRNAPWQLLLLALPALFIAIGLGGLYMTWRKAPADKTQAPARPLSSTAVAADRGAWFILVFFSLFLLIGLAVTATMAGQAADYLTVGTWDSIPATVVASRLREHSGDDGTTYSADVLYAYQVDGREYRSNRYAVFGGSSSGRKGKYELLNRYPAGARVTAYVNPHDPSEAVLERGLTVQAFLLLIPLCFSLAGGFGVYFSARHLRRRRAEARADESKGPSQPARRLFEPRKRADPEPTAARPAVRAVRGPVGGFELKPRQSPAVKLIVLCVFAAFWNGIVSVFLYQVVKSWASGRPDLCLSVFLIPFVAIGLALIVGVCHAVLTLFNPRVTITIGRAEITLGQTEELRWTITGRYDRIHRLVIRLKGHEEATYRRGTSTHTDKNTFFTADVVDTTRPAEVHSGRAKVTVPATTMHSFVAPNNKIVWSIEVHGHIAGWPDVKEEYELKVTPLPADDVGGGTHAREEAEREDAWTGA